MLSVCCRSSSAVQVARPGYRAMPGAALIHSFGRVATTSFRRGIAAACEPRIKHVISLPTTYSGLHMTLKQMRPGKAQQLISLFKAGDRKGTEALVAEERLPNSVFDWCVTQGMHITGTKPPFDFLTAIARHSLEGVLHNLKQDVLLAEGEQDHLFNVELLYRTMGELVCARSVTARIVTAREGGEQHCQLGNSAVAREEIVRWLAGFYPGLRDGAAVSTQRKWCALSPDAR
jgi:hypothetical protein